MPQENRVRGQQTESEEKVSMPDFVELWKELYFNAEDSWASATREFIASKSFIEMLDQIRDQYLSFYKVSRQNMDKYLEGNPLPSKKDIARIAELIIGMEDKIDNLDLHFYENINMLTSSLIKLVDFQEVVKQEILALNKETASINKKLNTINRKLNALTRSLDKEDINEED